MEPIDIYAWIKEIRQSNARRRVRIAVLRQWITYME